MKRCCYPQTVIYNLYAKACVCVHNDCTIRLDLTKWKFNELSKKENESFKQENIPGSGEQYCHKQADINMHVASP